MENKEDKTKDLATDFSNYKSDDNFWLGSLFLITALFGDWGNKDNGKDVESRISKLEAKNEILEKIILK